MKVKNSFNTGLRIGGRYFGPCQYADDQLVYLGHDNVVWVYASARDRHPSEVYLLAAGTRVYQTDIHGEYPIGTT